MSAKFELDWNGDAIARKIAAASLTGIDATMADAVNHAKRNHKWINDTGSLEGSIKIAEYAKRVGRGARGLWGSVDIVYALIHELGGTTGRGGATTIPARPYLRPAADAQYPGLAGNIRKALKRL